MKKLDLRLYTDMKSSISAVSRRKNSEAKEAGARSVPGVDGAARLPLESADSSCGSQSAALSVKLSSVEMSAEAPAASPSRSEVISFQVGSERNVAAARQAERASQKAEMEPSEPNPPK